MSTHFCRFLFLLLAGFLLTADNQVLAASVSGVDFSVVVERVDSTRGKKAIYRDTISPLLNIPAVGFWEVASVDMRVTGIDSIAVDFLLEVVMHGNNNRTFSKAYRADFGLPVRIAALEGSLNRNYQITLVPLSRFEQDTSGCSFSRDSGAAQEIHPTAHFRLSAPQGTLPAISLLSLGDQFEDAYNYFLRLINYSSSFMGNISLTPSASPTVLWPQEKKVMVDPSRGTIWMQYGIEHNGFDNTVISELLILRHDGYLPRPLLDGLSRFDSPDEWSTVQRRKSGEPIPSITPWLDDWTKPSPPATQQASSAFFRFLILRSSIDSLRAFALQADEYDLSGQLASHYAVPFDSLLTEWGRYLDTVHFIPRQLFLYSDRAATAFRFDEALRLQQVILPETKLAIDSTTTLERLTSYSFASGDYKLAAQYSLMRDSLSQAGAAYSLMAGESATAFQIYQTLQKKNDRDNGVRFGLAQYHLTVGSRDSAIPLLQQITEDLQSTMAQAESRAMLGLILPRTNGKRTAEADTFLVDASRWYQTVLAGPQSSPSQYVWYGMTLLAQGKYAEAEKSLVNATFLEVRPFYRAMAYLWLGKLSDLQKNRSRAREFYTSVLSMKAASYHRREAEQFLKTPFKL